MTKLIHQTGNIFTTQAQGIGHGVNTLGLMGHGIATQFRTRFPDMYEEYRALCRQGNLVPGTTFVYSPAENLFVYNIASQDMPGRNARLEWLKDGVEAALSHADENLVGTLALPRIGAGIGGLEWTDVEQVLRELAESHETDIEAWSL